MLLVVFLNRLHIGGRDKKLNMPSCAIVQANVGQVLKAYRMLRQGTYIQVIIPITSDLRSKFMCYSRKVKPLSLSLPMM